VAHVKPMRVVVTIVYVALQEKTYIVVVRIPATAPSAPLKPIVVIVILYARRLLKGKCRSLLQNQI
jgi:hypothetical protein